jgi:putative transposase
MTIILAFWKKQLLDAFPAAFSSGKDKDAEKNEGVRDHLNRKRIQRLMRLIGFESIVPKPDNSRHRKENKVYHYLLNKLSITKPNQVWCSEITYIRLAHGFVYLTAVMDSASRYELSWEVSVSMDDDFCVNAVKSAMRKHKTPDIFNTD